MRSIQASAQDSAFELVLDPLPSVGLQRRFTEVAHLDRPSRSVFLASSQHNVFSLSHLLSYWAPDSLKWELLGFEFSEFLQWSLTSCIPDFYQNLRWAQWKHEVAKLPGEQCFTFHPPLWTKEGSVTSSRRKTVPISEAFDLKADIARQSSEGDN